MIINNKDFIVSCQALEHEPLHSSYIMSKLALAASMGGAKGIRANTVDDIKAIKNEVDLPLIGIIKKDFTDSDIYITPTMNEIDDLVEAGADVIALDATNRLRPGKIELVDFYASIKNKYPNILLMADCSTFEEMHSASSLGFDYIGTTLFGYTPYSKKSAFEDYDIFKEKTKSIKSKIIAEGQISTPSQASEILKLDNIYAIVVGGAITRPMDITSRFIKACYEE